MSNVIWLTIIVAEQTEWITLPTGTQNSNIGRCSQENVFKQLPGLKRLYGKKITSALDAWRLFINDKILRIVLHWSSCEDFPLSLTRLESFVALQYARGIYGKNHSVAFLWSEHTGPSIFRRTMCRDEFKRINGQLWFDDKSTRNGRRQEDPFTLIREVFEEFTKNCRTVYTPNFSLTIDEQLMPLKTKCRLITYMPNKPDKYGIKF